MRDALAAFLLAFPALVAVVNPVAAGFMFRDATADRTEADRRGIARRVALYALLVMLGAMWGGTYVLGFFGISIAALRITGGTVVALFAWDVMNAPERREARKTEQAGAAGGMDDIAFYPLTLPVTTGPGTIAVAIALAAGRPSTGAGMLGFVAGASAACLAMALVIWATLTSSGRLAALLGPSGSRIVTRLSAFLLMCIGVQIVITGANELLAPLLSRQ